MKTILILGSGGREHALACALDGPDRKIIVSPGNAGISQEFECYSNNTVDYKTIAQNVNPDIIIVGPEQILVSGEADNLRDQGFIVFGPTKAAAKIEGSKVFMKRLCVQAGVPTAPFAVFTDLKDLKEFSQFPSQAKRFVKELERAVGAKCALISMGKSREETLVLEKNFPWLK